MRNVTIKILVIFLACITLSAARPSTAIAAGDSGRLTAAAAPWERSCDSFRGARQFISVAELYCLNRGSACSRQAQSHFRACEFKGNYGELAKSMYSRMVFAVALSSTSVGAPARPRRQDS